MTDVPEPELRVRVFEEFATATKQLGQIFRDLARLRAEPDSLARPAGNGSECARRDRRYRRRSHPRASR